MGVESWLVKKDRVWAMRFLKDKHPDEDGTTYIRVHYARCRLRFLTAVLLMFNFMKVRSNLWKSKSPMEVVSGNRMVSL